MSPAESIEIGTKVMALLEELRAAIADNASLRAALQEADRIMGHDDMATDWRERWAHLWLAAKL